MVIPMGEIKPVTVKFLDILDTDISECGFRTLTDVLYASRGTLCGFNLI